MRAHKRRAARNLAISSRKLLCALKKNDSRSPTRSTSRPASIAGLHVRDGVGEGEGHFLHRRRPRLPDVIPADRDRVPVGHLALAEGEHIGHDPQRRPRRINVGAARDVFLENVVLNRPCQLCRCHPLPPADSDIEGEQDGCRRVDGHGRRHAIERDALEQCGHVFDRVDRHPDAADFTCSERMIGVVSHLRRQIECHAQPADAVGEQVAIAGVGFFRGAEARILTHRPQPAAVHRRLDAAREWKFAGKSEFGCRIPIDEVVGSVETGRSGLGNGHVTAKDRRIRSRCRAGFGGPDRTGDFLPADACGSISSRRAGRMAASEPSAATRRSPVSSKSFFPSWRRLIIADYPEAWHGLGRAAQAARER